MGDLRSRRLIAEVIINSSVKNLNKTFDYNIPADIAGIIKLGDRVLVPFGNVRKLEEGFVVGFKEKSEYNVKNIAIAYIPINKINTLSFNKTSTGSPKLFDSMLSEYFIHISNTTGIVHIIYLEFKSWHHNE